MSSLDSLLARVTRPTLLLDAERARANIERMARKTARAGVRLRPHFKTHQSAGVGEWFREAGTEAITVSSVDMARYFAGAGWRDITIAVPVNLRQLDELRSLAREVDLSLLVDDEAVLRALTRAVDVPLELWIKVDVGYGRAGIRWDDPDRIVSLAAAVAQGSTTRLAGLLTHAGHTYHARSPAEILGIHEESVGRLARLRDRVAEAGGGRCGISVGDTPGCSLADNFSEVDDVRPGNYVFYDLTQIRLGACSGDDVAVAVACPVIGVYPARDELVLYGGAVHLSKDFLNDDERNHTFGCLATEGGRRWLRPDWRCPVVSLSQEHGVVRVPSEVARKARVGDVVLVIPVHSCLTAELYSDYLCTNGEAIPRR